MVMRLGKNGDSLLTYQASPIQMELFHSTYNCFCCAQLVTWIDEVPFLKHTFFSHKDTKRADVQDAFEKTFLKCQEMLGSEGHRLVRGGHAWDHREMSFF